MRKEVNNEISRNKSSLSHNTPEKNQLLYNDVTCSKIMFAQCIPFSQQSQSPSANHLYWRSARELPQHRLPPTETQEANDVRESSVVSSKTMEQ